MNTSSKNRWWLDAALFAAFILSFFLDLTGISLHQWLGVVLGFVAVYHLVTHWSWVSAVTRRFFGMTSDQARAYYLLDAVLLGGFLTIVLSGLVISTWLDLSLANYTLWRVGHIMASITTLLVLVLKIAQHGPWIVSVGRKIFAPAAAPAGKLVPAPLPLAVPASSSRRDFIKLMGIVGAASLVALGSSVSGIQDAEASEQTGASSTAALPSAATSSSCVVACSRRCSYPGHCRRYTDSNSNGRCDLGECQV